MFSSKYVSPKMLQWFPIPCRWVCYRFRTPTSINNSSTCWTNSNPLIKHFSARYPKTCWPALFVMSRLAFHSTKNSRLLMDLETKMIDSIQNIFPPHPPFLSPYSLNELSHSHAPRPSPPECTTDHHTIRHVQHSRLTLAYPSKIPKHSHLILPACHQFQRRYPFL